MTSRRTQRRDHLRERDRAEKIAQGRDRYLLYGVIALTGPLVGVLYGGIPAIGLGSLVGVLVAAYFFHAARSRIPRPSRLTNPSATQQSMDSYERSLRERMERERRDS